MYYKLKKIQQFIGIIFVGYIVLMYISPQLANFALAVFLVGSIPGLILYNIYKDKMYKYSITMVSRQFVLKNNALHNEHCTVIYTPDEKIVVMDNIADRKRAKRMFTLSKGKLSVNKAWNRLCRVFDSFITLDSLAAFFSHDTKIDIITLESKIVDTAKPQNITVENKTNAPKFVEMGEITPDTYAKGLETPNDKGAEFIDMGNIKEQKPVAERTIDAPEFKDMGDILSNSSQKIDVNTAVAGELAILPGINIVGAKKIVEYRDINGIFNSEEEFLKAANVKEHFVPKIRSMIIIGKPVEKTDDEDFDQGRIIDL